MVVITLAIEKLDWMSNELLVAGLLLACANAHCRINGR